MTTYPKIADNEMNYFQFKARQMLLLKKEDCKWQEFCKQVAPECAACLAELTDAKECKDIGIQAKPRTTFKKFERPSLQPRQQSEQIPEALNNIRTRLENIDLALCKIYDVSSESKEKKFEGVPTPRDAQALKLFEEKRRCLIQNSLKTSLEKLHTFGPKVTKKSPAIKLKNSSYFLPHDLQVKRAAARKAYLASLQTKPKIAFRNERQIAKKNIQSNQNKKVACKLTPKLRKKVVTKKITKGSGDKEETLIAAIEVDETKDENIEYVVDTILEDLVGEAALDLNKIKQRRIGRLRNALDARSVEKEKETVLSGLLTSSPVKNTEPKTLAHGDNHSITKLKLFLESSKISQQNENLRNELFTEKMSKNASSVYAEDSKYVCEETDTGKNYIDIFQPKQLSRLSPKFLCGVSHTITINPQKAKDISLNRERYRRYLKNISRTVKGNFNPWILNNMLAESILDDCINEIAEELSSVPSTFVQDLYNQEFIQQVAD